MGASALRIAAPAKINLYLHVLGRRSDGFHELDSLVAFADIADVVTARPADTLTLAIDGPFAAELTGASDENLILRAARLLASRAGVAAEAALRIAPEIETVLDRLGRLPGALLARMSGSGATCFALFADREAALAAGALLGRLEPGWWIAAGALLAATPAVHRANARKDR